MYADGSPARGCGRLATGKGLTVRRRLIRIVAIFGLLAGLIPTLTLQPAFAAGVVGTGTAASCTEAAFNAALAGGGLVTFNCGPGVVTIPLTTAKTIAANTQIDGDNDIRLDMGDNDRHFVVNPGVTLRLDRIQLRNGNVVGDGGSILNAGTVIGEDVSFDSNFATGNGGAIRNDGTLSLIHGGVLINNRATGGGHGGAIFNGGAGVVSLLEDAVVVNNRATGAGQGGAIFNDGGSVQVFEDGIFLGNEADLGGSITNASGGVVTIDDGIFIDEEARTNGGAIANLSGSVSIANSLFANNNAPSGDGGVIYNLDGAGNVTIERSLLSTNEAYDQGGAIWNGSLMTITDSRIESNEATDGSGGGVFNANTGTIHVIRSTFEDNESGFRGGGMRNGGTATIQTSTFSGNESDRQGGGVVNHEDMTITDSTFTLNSSSGSPGGGIRNSNDGVLDMGNTIVADNPSGGDCSNVGTFNSLDYNLDSDGTCPIGMANDISSGNANLGPLADNGGETQTHLPGPGSDAIDAGPGGCASPDQRGQVRPQNGVCDIGSVEIIPPADVCYNTWTLALHAPTAGECNGPYLQKVVFEDFGPHYLCRNISTGQLSYSYLPTCAPYNLPAIVMPDAAPLDVCLNIYTQAVSPATRPPDLLGW